ncbi:MAG: hypothetical protein V4576_03310 [Patescibacteria group bacterium]
MKTLKPEVVLEIVVHPTGGRTAYNSYRFQESDGAFMDLIRLEDSIYSKFRTTSLHHGFIVCIIGYSLPKFGAPNGVSRREVTSTLRYLQLNSPSSVETLLIASQVARSYEFNNLILEHDGRPIVATTPFHPEAPTYFEFGMAMDTTSPYQYFFRKPHREVGGATKIYFGEYEATQSNQMWLRNNPFIVGIKAT